MRARGLVPLSLFTTLCLLGCTTKPDDKRIESTLVGVWTWNPHEQLPADKIQTDTGIYATPIQEIFQFGPVDPNAQEQGEYIEYWHVPENGLMKQSWISGPEGHWLTYKARINVSLSRSPYIGRTFDILSISPSQLRVQGPEFECKDGCVLVPLKEVPEAAKNGRQSL